MDILNSKLAGFTDEQLEDELKDRQKLREERDKPSPVESPDWSVLVRLCKEYIDVLSHWEMPDDDFDHLVFECAMGCIYGQDVWHWVNDRL